MKVHAGALSSWPEADVPPPTPLGHSIRAPSIQLLTHWRRSGGSLRSTPVVCIQHFVTWLRAHSEWRRRNRGDWWL